MGQDRPTPLTMRAARDRPHRGSVRLTGAWGVLALILIFARPLHAQELLKVELEGEHRVAAQIEKRAKELEASLKSLESETTPAVVKRREALQQAIAAAQSLGGLMQRLDQLPEMRRETEGKLASIRRELEESHLKAQEEFEPSSISDAELRELEVSFRVAAQSVPLAESAALKAANHLQERERAFEALGEEIARLLASFEAQRSTEAPLEGQTPDPNRDLHRLRAEAQLRAAELIRERHSDLRGHDALLRDLTREEHELAKANHSDAERRVVKAREVRQKTLAEEASQAREEAEAALAAARAAKSPAEKSISAMKAQVSEFSAKSKEDESALGRAQTLLMRVEDLANQTAGRTKTLKRLLPDDVDLEDWQTDALREEDDRLVRQRSVWNQGLGSEVHQLAGNLRQILRERDQLRGLKTFLNLRSTDPASDWDVELLKGHTDPAHEECVSSVQVFRQAIKEVQRPEDASELRLRFETEIRNLREIVDQRITHLTKSEELIQSTLASRDAVVRSFAERGRYIDRLAFWLKGPPPLGNEELGKTREELSSLKGSVPVLAESARVLWSEHARLLGGTAQLWSILAAVLLLAWFVGRSFARRWDRVSAEPVPRRTDSFGRARRVFWGVVGSTGFTMVLMIVLTIWSFAIRPHNPRIRVLWSLVSIWWGIGASSGLVNSLLALANRTPRDPVSRPDATSPDDSSAESAEEATETRHAFRFFRILLMLVAVLLPASFALDAVGLPRLAFFTRLLLGVLGLVWAIRVYFRPDLIEGFLPVGSTTLASAVRTGIIRLWPLGVVFYLGTVVLRLIGYEEAPWYYGSRFLLCGAIILGTIIIYHVLQGVISRRWGPPLPFDEDHDNLDDPDPQQLRSGFLRRVISLLLFAGACVFGVWSVGSVLGFTGDTWTEIKAFELWSGFGGDHPLTIGNLLGAALIFVVGLTLARFVRDALQVSLSGRMQRGSRYAVRTLVYYFIAGMGLFSALSALGLDLQQLGWFLTAAGVGIGFGLQEIISNFISGLILFFERPVQVGDIITVGAVEGDVKRINIRSTLVRTRDGISIIIPNKRLITDDVVNWTHGDERTRVIVPVSVAYGSDLALVRRILTEVAEREGRILARPKAEVSFVGFGESELKFELLLWLPRPDLSLRRRIVSDINFAIDASFRRAGVQIPFPQRDLHIKEFPDHGDEEMSEAEEETTLGD